jgi:hypothetical protein
MPGQVAAAPHLGHTCKPQDSSEQPYHDDHARHRQPSLIERRGLLAPGATRGKRMVARVLGAATRPRRWLPLLVGGPGRGWRCLLGRHRLPGLVLEFIAGGGVALDVAAHGHEVITLDVVAHKIVGHDVIAHKIVALEVVANRTKCHAKVAVDLSKLLGQQLAE